MTTADVFSLVNLLAMLMWALMVIAPKRKVTTFLVQYRIIPILLSLVYVTYIAISLASGGAFDFSTLSSVMELFTDPVAVLAGWVHYLAFDLLVGMWILEQNRTVGLHPLLMVPCLLFTFMFGPVGFLLFFILKSLKK